MTKKSKKLPKNDEVKAYLELLKKYYYVIPMKWEPSDAVYNPNLPHEEYLEMSSIDTVLDLIDKLASEVSNLEIFGDWLEECLNGI